MYSEKEKYDVATHFSFGKNWASYSDKIDNVRIESAREGLHKLISPAELKDKSFIDIGCGSGLHMLCALQSGVDYAVGIDFDQDSVSTTKQVLQNNYAASNYKVIAGNILEDKMQELGKFDVVYSWGVLHHTGDMLKAISNSAALVCDSGKFILALYKKTPRCDRWINIKRFFARSNRFVKFVLTLFYVAATFIAPILLLRNPFKNIVQRGRGMNVWNDAVDWLGGYPYESINISELEVFMKKEGFNLLKSFDTKPGSGRFSSGCAEYVFQKI